MSRAPALRLALDQDEIVIDNFCGGGGASEGIETVLREMGRHVDIAVNHAADAIALHKANHPNTEHYTTDVFHIDIVKACRGRRVGFGWYSPDCSHHSKARGGKPFRDRNKARRIRGLAWVIVKQAKELRDAGTPIRIIGMENVQEFADWGPLDDEGKIIAIKKGFTFRRWCKQLANLGYELDMWTLKGCDYGSPTIRERLFIVARYDAKAIVKPEASHGRGLKPYRVAADIIDFSIPCPSIFDRKKPLADNTLRRIAEGIKRFIDTDEAFIIPVAHAGDSRANSIREPVRTITAERRGDFALVAPVLVPRYGEDPDPKRRGGKGQAPRVRSVRLPLPAIVTTDNGAQLAAVYLAKQNGVDEKMVIGQDLSGPVHTITARDQKALVSAFLLKYKGTCKHGQRLDEPVHTIQAEGTHFAEVRTFLIKYYSEGGQWGSLKEPLGTITTKDRIGLVTIRGEQYRIVDIGLRMLTARELYRAQGFPESYIIDLPYNGKPLTKTAQVRMCGNSVNPQVAEAILRAQLTEQVLEAVA